MIISKKSFENNKIQLSCYCASSICFKCFGDGNDKWYLEEPLKFVPFSLEFSENEARRLVKILNNPSARIKITIEEE